MASLPYNLKTVYLHGTTSTGIYPFENLYSRTSISEPPLYEPSIIRTIINVSERENLYPRPGLSNLS